MISKEKIQSIKLSGDENSHLNDFIGKAVRGNYKFNILTNKVGVAPQCGVQEVYNQNTETLIIYAALLDKQIRGHVTNFDPFAEGNDVFMVGKVKGDTLLTILKLIIREKSYNAAMSERVATANSLQSQLDDLKTPEERRKDIEKQLAELTT